MRDRSGNSIQNGDRVVFPTSLLGPIADGVVLRVGPSIVAPQPANGQPQLPAETLEVRVLIRFDVPVGTQIREIAVTKDNPRGEVQ